MLASLPIHLDREADGRWIAEVSAIPGVIVYGASPEQAVAAARRLAADVITDRQAHGEAGIEIIEPVAERSAPGLFPETEPSTRET